jgi:putative endonuclease
LIQRLLEHNQGVYAGSFTKRSTDWEYFLVLTCVDSIHARKVEAHIKKMRNRRYIENLHKYESMREDLVRRYV